MDSITITFVLIILILLILISKWKETYEGDDSEKLLRKYIQESYKLKPEDGYFEKEFESYKLKPEDGYFEKEFESFVDIEHRDKPRSVRVGRAKGGVPVGGQFVMKPYVARVQEIDDAVTFVKAKYLIGKSRDEFTSPGSRSRLVTALSGAPLARGFDDSHARRIGTHVMI
jgi:hypothetical protein